MLIEIENLRMMLEVRLRSPFGAREEIGRNRLVGPCRGDRLITDWAGSVASATELVCRRRERPDEVVAGAAVAGGLEAGLEVA